MTYVLQCFIPYFDYANISPQLTQILFLLSDAEYLEEYAGSKVICKTENLGFCLTNFSCHPKVFSFATVKDYLEELEKNIEKHLNPYIFRPYCTFNQRSIDYLCILIKLLDKKKEFQIEKWQEVLKWHYPEFEQEFEIFLKICLFSQNNKQVKRSCPAIFATLVSDYPISSLVELSSEEWHQQMQGEDRVIKFRNKKLKWQDFYFLFLISKRPIQSSIPVQYSKIIDPYIETFCCHFPEYKTFFNSSF